MIELPTLKVYKSIHFKNAEKLKNSADPDQTESINPAWARLSQNL